MKYLFITLVMVCTSLIALGQQHPAIKGEPMVRMAKITVDPDRLGEYKDFLKEEIETSLLLEPGVLSLYAISEKENPTNITIFEIYADEEAYKKHIQTPHFLKYKVGTADMVLLLELIDVDPLLPALTISGLIKDKEPVIIQEQGSFAAGGN